MRQFVGLVCALGCFTAQSALAATLYIDPPRSELNRGDVQVLQVRLDTDEAQSECINAVSGVVQISGPVTPVDVSLGESIFPVWIEQPTINAENKTVQFAGGIPNGYCGRVDGDPRLTNKLFEIIVRADATIDLEESQVATATYTTNTTAYLNDGSGTRADLDVLPARITVSPVFGEDVVDPWSDSITSDTIPPQEFSIALEQDQFAFQGRYFISFNTTDKQTGISHYEIIEEPLSQMSSFGWGRADAPWQRVRSPYVLDDQSLNSVIRVKAVDKAGNEYIANLVPDESLRSVSNTAIVLYVVIGVVGLVVLGLGLLYVARRRTKKITQYSETFDDADDSTDQSYEIPN